VCSNCGNIVKFELDTLTENILAIYGNECTDLMRTLLRRDFKHYRSFFKTIKSNNQELAEKNFSIIYSLGGGMPKLESFFHHDSIEISDACADTYLNYLSDFSSIYTYNKDLIYTKS